MRICALLLASCLFSPLFAAADDEPHHHEELTEAQLGTVHFPSSCLASEQKPIERGVAMLHSFWYEEAEKEFQQIAKDDPKCAIAHWGVAMSIWHQLWNRPDRPVLDRGNAELKTARSLPATPREKDYIAALSKFYSHPRRPYQKRVAAYSRAMQKVYERNAEDHEAAAFYGLSLLAAEPDGDTNNEYRKKAAAVLEKLFAEELNHPGVAHYLIHTYDKPDMAQLGLPAARRYAQIAPAAPHALHMPSHIFARLGLWQDDIDSNVRSIEATRREAAEHMGGEGHQFHAMDFLVYAYLQTGREADAQRIIDEVEAMPPMKDMYGMGMDPRMFAMVAFPAAYVLELHRWIDAAQLYPVSGAGPWDLSITYMTRAIGAARSGNAEQARREISQIEALKAKLESEHKQQTGAYEGVSTNLTIARAWGAFADNKADEGVQLLRGVAGKKRGEAEASDGIPASEMIADMLFEVKRPQQALVEYEATLKSDPGRFNALYGAAQAAERAGQNQKANEYYSQLVKNCEGAKSDRAELKHAREFVEMRAGRD